MVQWLVPWLDCDECAGMQWIIIIKVEGMDDSIYKYIYI